MTHEKSKLNIDCLLFAGNEILVNVDHSYREVVAKAVQIYMEQAVGLPSSQEPLITLDDVILLQKKGQFTSYWDLTTAFVMYFAEMLPPVPVPTFPSKFHIPGLMAYLQMAGGNLRISIDTLREQRDIAQLAEDVANAGGGLDGAHQTLTRTNRHMLVSSGEITKTNVLARIFQELYLGTTLFEQTYSQPAFVVHNEGLYEQETLVIKPGILAALSERMPLGVISDRPRQEIEQSLKTQQIDSYFQTIVALEDIKQGQANPVPDAWPLLEAARRLSSSGKHSAYVGANVGDIQAAKAANDTQMFTAIGCVVGTPDKSALREAFEAHKANIILGHPNHLKESILG
ncbi:MAG: HAD hydrolase-like protein [Anaerolineae bacterium]|nr:HAD hydrolase-like protein [Anaerolineae bacterium]